MAAQIVVGVRYRLSANPVLDTAGTRLGSVVEWADVTDQLVAESGKLASGCPHQDRARWLRHQS
ncbi:hypothetical protein EJG51_000465 [Undibacterium piscinae]|uniref:Uncharacterized protein n=1 Tax=Undibacterium piscinae TaxID=2495591 RepID=A0A6M4A3A5_9BURK|nr:hypothetical protein EJG51_000465 [Undibacterium piscinae]